MNNGNFEPPVMPSFRENVPKISALKLSYETAWKLSAQGLAIETIRVKNDPPVIEVKQSPETKTLGGTYENGWYYVLFNNCTVCWRNGNTEDR